MRIILIILLLLNVPMFAPAEEEPRRNLMSFGSQSLVINHDSPGIDNGRFGGFSVAYQRAMGEKFALRLAYLAMEEQEGGADLTGGEVQFLAGPSFLKEGFRFSAGVGYFYEKIEGDRFDGAELIGSLGYNWPLFTLDFQLALRDSTDYRDRAGKIIGAKPDTASASSTLSLGVRF